MTKEQMIVFAQEKKEYCEEHIESLRSHMDRHLKGKALKDDNLDYHYAQVELTRLGIISLNKELDFYKSFLKINS